MTALPPRITRRKAPAVPDTQNRLAAGLRAARTNLLMRRDAGLIGTIAALVVVLSVLSPAFRTTGNALNILDQWTPIGIIACAMTVALVARGFDLSAGAVYAFAGLVAAKTTLLTHDPWLGFLAACLAGLLIGAANAVMIVVVRINPFVATLATSVIVGGVTLAVSKGYLVVVDTPGFATPGRGSFLHVKYATYALALVAGTCWFLLSRTRFGRHCYAVGGAEEAARLAGVRVRSVQAATYVLLGLAAAIAGVIVTARTSTAQTDADSYQILFQVFTAVIVGGTPIHGGEGSIGKTLLGLLLIGLVGDGFILMNVTATLQQVFLGCILLLAIGYDAYLGSTVRQRLLSNSAAHALQAS